MNLLIDRLPKTVNIQGETYKINTDFRISILFELLIKDVTVAEDKKLEEALKLYYPNIPGSIDKAVENIMWFYRCGKDLNTQKSSKVTNNNPKEIYSFEYDDEYIYAAFLDQYNIDLQDIEYLHWWKFRALFKSLKKDNEIIKIMGYRSMDINKDMSQSEKDFYKSMKEIYALPKSQNEIKRVGEIENALLNGGDISKLLQ